MPHNSISAAASKSPAPLKIYDGDILTAFDRRREAQRALLDLPDGADPCINGEASRLEDFVCLAEGFFHLSVAQSPRGVEIQLWAALSHMLDDPEHDWRTYTGDLEYFSRISDTLDWPLRLILAAIRSLRAMQEGGAA